MIARTGGRLHAEPAARPVSMSGKNTTGLRVTIHDIDLCCKLDSPFSAD